MTDNTGTNKTPELSGISPWPRVLLATGNIGFFVTAFLLLSWFARSLAWWIALPIFLVSLEAVDLLLRAVLLRPERRNRAEPGAAAAGSRD